jgi:hypothetical protein
MQTLTKDRVTKGRVSKDQVTRDRTRSRETRGNCLLLALLASTLTLAACGSSSSAGGPIQLSLSGNWQFTMAPPSDGSFFGGLQGGFLLQNGNSATGTTTYAVSLPDLLIPCNAGTAAITASITSTIDNQNVWTLTAVAGTQTFTLQGVQNFDGTTMAGTYDSTAGTAPDGTQCGTVQTGLQWSAVLVPSITGNIQGSFHSTGGSSGLANQDFPVSGSLTQAQNTGASNVTVTGTLNFAEAGNVSDYPCFQTASVYGEISGSSVTLQIVGTDESILGQIGAPAGSNGATGLSPATVDSTPGGNILHAVGPSYLVATSACPGSVSSTATAGDYGDICIAVGSSLGSPNACQEPITLAPATVTLLYPPPPPATTSTQNVMLTNSSRGALSGLTLAFVNIPISAANFTETDNCGPGGVPSQGEPFSLATGSSCLITITFAPQCGAQCSSPLSATLTVTSPLSADDDNVFTVPITGTVTGEGASLSSSNRIFQDANHNAETN